MTIARKAATPFRFVTLPVYNTFAINIYLDPVRDLLYNIIRNSKPNSDINDRIAELNLWRNDMEIKVRLERDEDGMYVVTCPSLPGCISQGKSEKMALSNIKEAIKLHLRALAEDGLPLVQEKQVKEKLIKVTV